MRNKPTDLSACVSEEREHGEGGGVYAALLSDTRDIQLVFLLWSLLSMFAIPLSMFLFPPQDQ